MPTQRFFHLKEEKKNIIKQAAMEECARVPYADISINQIIKAADISRGSFYTYFEDKDDLIRYLLQDFCDACKKYILDQIEKADGDVVEAAENMRDDSSWKGSAKFSNIQKPAVKCGDSDKYENIWFWRFSPPK